MEITLRNIVINTALLTSKIYICILINNKYLTSSNVNNKGVILSTINSLSENKEISEFSTKITAKDGIDYIFSNYKFQIYKNESLSNATNTTHNTSGFNKNEEIVNPLELIADLSNTYEINNSLIDKTIDNVFNSKNVKNNSKTKRLKQKLSDINTLYKKKSKKRKNLNEMKGNNLLKDLIYFEHKRKNEESIAHYQNQINNLNEGMENKIESKTSLEKKLKEYEKYINKHSKNSNEEKFYYLREFNILKFYEENTELAEKVDSIKATIFRYEEYIKSLKQELENNDLKQKNNINNKDIVSCNDNSNDGKLSNKNNKLKKIIVQYIDKINQLEINIATLNRIKHKIGEKKHIHKSNNKIVNIDNEEDHNNISQFNKSKYEKGNKNISILHYKLNETKLEGKLDITDYNDLLGNTRFDHNITKILPKDILDITHIPKNSDK